MCTNDTCLSVLFTNDFMYTGIYAQYIQCMNSYYCLVHSILCLCADLKLFIQVHVPV